MNTNKAIIIGLVVVGIAAVALWASSGNNTQKSVVNELLGGEKVVIYKSPTCGCCEVYSSYLKSEGVAVDVQNVVDLNVVKEKFNISPNLQSCHTMEVGGYVVEGHVPLAVV